MEFSELVQRLKEIEEREGSVVESSPTTEACNYSNPAMEGHTYHCKDCGCEMHNCRPDCDCPHDSHDEQGNWWVDENGNGVPDAFESKEDPQQKVSESTKEENYVHNMFMKMITMVDVMEKGVRPEGLLAKRIDEIGGDTAWLDDVRSRLNALGSAVEDAHMGAMAHIHEDDESIVTREGKYKVGYRAKKKKY
jgi:hypothetical protein